MIEIRQSALALAAAAFLATSAEAETLLTFGGSDAVGSLLDRTNARFAELVNQRAAGELTVNFISGEALGNDIQVIEQMMEGSVHLYGDVLDWYANWVKDFGILNWGFTFRDNDHMQAFLDSEIYTDLAERLRQETGLRILAVAPTQPRVLFARKAIASPTSSPASRCGCPRSAPTCCCGRRSAPARAGSPGRRSSSASRPA